MDAESLVFGADEDSTNDVAGDEKKEETVMEFGVVDGVEDGKEDEPAGAGYGEEDYLTVNALYSFQWRSLREALLDSPLSTFSAIPRFLARRPVCRSHLSEAKLKSRKTVVTTQPVMKRGLRPWAPMSDMYAIL